MRRRRKIKALVAVWHRLNDPQATYQDLGPNHHDTQTATARQKRLHIRQLEALGY